MLSKTGKVLALFAVLFVLASPQGLSAEGLRGGFDDAFGPQFHPDARQDQPKSNIVPGTGSIGPAAFAIGIRSPSMPAALIILLRLLRKRPACSANNLGQVAQPGRWPSSISPSSKS